MSKYKLIRFSGAEADYIFRQTPKAEGLKYPTRDVFEMRQVATENGLQSALFRMDVVLSYAGETISFNPGSVLYETDIPDDSKIVPFIESVDKHAAEEVSKLILS